MIETDFMFEKVVGQDAAKGQISHYHKNRFQRNGVFPHALLSGAKGNGKTELAKAIGRGLWQLDPDTNLPALKSDGKTPLPRKFIEINASTIKNVSQLINSVLIPHVVDKEVTIFIDEAANIPHKVSEAFLTMLNPNEINKTTFVDIDSNYVVELDFSKVCFIFATTDVQLLADPLVNRLKRIDIEDYTLAHLAEIMCRNLPGVDFDDGVLLDIATTVRGNARQAVDRAKDMQDVVKNKKFGAKQWTILKKALHILPLGLSPLELSILRIMKGAPEGITLTGIAARTGLSAHAIQKDYEIYLQKLNLMTITAGKGRTLTPKGMNYLHDLEVVS